MGFKPRSYVSNSSDFLQVLRNHVVINKWSTSTMYLEIFSDNFCVSLFIAFNTEIDFLIPSRKWDISFLEKSNDRFNFKAFALVKLIRLFWTASLQGASTSRALSLLWALALPELRKNFEMQVTLATFKQHFTKIGPPTNDLSGTDGELHNWMPLACH